MKAIILYYSYTGNTEKVADILAEYLRSKYEVKVLKLDAQNESVYFLGQAIRAFFHRKARLPSNVECDLSGYDLICLGTPVWAFGPAPAMNAYLEKCCGLENKSVVLFTTHGSGVGITHCLNYMQEILSKKRARDFRRFSIQAIKVNNKDFINTVLREQVQFS